MDITKIEADLDSFIYGYQQEGMLPSVAKQKLNELIDIQSKENSCKFAKWLREKTTIESPLGLKHFFMDGRTCSVDWLYEEFLIEEKLKI